MSAEGLIRPVRKYEGEERCHYVLEHGDAEVKALCGVGPDLPLKWKRVGRTPKKVCQGCLSVASAQGLRLSPQYETPPRRTQSMLEERTGDLFSGEVPVLVAATPKPRAEKKHKTARRSIVAAGRFFRGRA